MHLNNFMKSFIIGLIYWCCVFEAANYKKKLRIKQNNINNYIAVDNTTISNIFSALPENRLTINNNEISCKNIKKTIWIMGVGSTNKDAAMQYYNFVIAAINSAKFNAPSLLPHIIHSGDVSTLPKELTKLSGVKFLSHNLSFIDKLVEYQENPKAFGAFYRIDIPLLMKRILPLWDAAKVDSEYVLYTDTDVLFFNDFNGCNLPNPKVMYIGPESIRGKQHNSGILYINVTAFAEHLPALMKFAESKKWHFAACDQGLIMQYFRDQNMSTLLPDKYNWKGYWGGGDDDDVVIGHFHAAKPGRCLDCYLMYRQTINVCNCKHYDAFFKAAMKVDNGHFYEKMLIAYRNFSSIKLF